MADYALEVVVSVVAWLIANWAYMDFRRRGERGFKRVVAFFMGAPTTFATALWVEEGSEPRIRADDADLDQLLHEIRTDRAIRGGGDAE